MTDQERLRLVQIQKRKLLLQQKGPDLAALQAEDKPLQDVSLTPVTDPDIQEAGVQTAEALGKRGHPIAGAVAGTAVQMAPDIAMAATGMRPVKAAAEAGELIGKQGIQKAGQVLETLKGPSLEEAKAMQQVANQAFRPETAARAERFSRNVIDPVKAEVDSIASRLSQLPGKTADKLKILQEKLGMAGKEMGAAEEAAGFGFKSSPEFEQAIKNPKTMEKTLKVAEGFSKMGPEKVAETVDPKSIQLVRKLAQEGTKEKTLSELGNAGLQKGREVAGQALGILDKRFGNARKEYQTIVDAIKDVETNSPRMAQQLRAQLKETKMKLASLQADAKDLLTAAKDADKARLLDIKRKSLDLIRKGIEHDKLVRQIKQTAYAIGGTAAAGVGLKKAL